MNKEIIQSMKILPIGQIIPFEWELNLSESLSIDEYEYIRHPFLITKISGNRYLLLEQSAEFYQIKKAGIKEIPVQIIPKEKIKLVQNKIGLYSITRGDVDKFIREYSDCLPSTNRDISNNHESSYSVRFTFEDEQFELTLASSKNSGCSESLDALFHFLEENGGYRMERENNKLTDSIMKIHRYSASLEMPLLTPDNLLAGGSANRLYPPGIVKVTTDTRMLFVDFPVSVLDADISITEKEDFLKQLITLREETEKTSYYRGSIYLFNR